MRFAWTVEGHVEAEAGERGIDRTHEFLYDAREWMREHASEYGVELVNEDPRPGSMPITNTVWELEA